MKEKKILWQDRNTHNYFFLMGEVNENTQSSLDIVYTFFSETELGVDQEGFLHCKRMHIEEIVKQKK